MRSIQRWVFLVVHPFISERPIKTTSRQPNFCVMNESQDYVEQLNGFFRKMDIFFTFFLKALIKKCHKLLIHLLYIQLVHCFFSLVFLHLYLIHFSENFYFSFRTPHFRYVFDRIFHREKTGNKRQCHSVNYNNNNNNFI